MARGKQIKAGVIEKSISECLTIYLKSCIVKNLSVRTIKTYRNECNHFIAWYGADKSIRKVTYETIEDYIVHIKSTGISQMYVVTRIRQLRAFFYFCMEREYLRPFKIQLPKVDEVIKEPYTTKELEKLIRKPATTSWVEWRSWALTNYLLSTGNRISTALNVKVSDIDFENNVIRLRVIKNRKQQYIPMSTELNKVLKTYLNLWDYENSDYLFPEYEGNQLSVHGAYTAMKKYNISRGVTKTSMHLYRHTFAKNYIISGGDSMYLQRLLGHSTLAMTNHYVRLYSTDLQKNFDKYNPLDNLTKEMREVQIHE